MSEANRRAKLFMKTPNPVYLSWLEDWLLEASAKSQPKRIRELTAAIESLKKYPVRLNSAKECIILENFSRQLVDEIEKREKLDLCLEEQSTNVYITVASRPLESPKKAIMPTSKSPAKPNTSIPINTAKLSPEKASKHKSFSPPKTYKRKAQSPVKLQVPKLSPAKVPCKYPLTSSISDRPSSSTAYFSSSQPSFSTGPHSWDPLPNAALDEEAHQKQLSLVRDLIAPSKTALKSRKKETRSADIADEDMITLDTDPMQEESIIFAPETFEVIMLIDTGEKGFLSSVSDFADPEFRYEVRHLKVGDYAWVARGSSQKELLLPFLVERKRLDDLSKSVKDGRFSEQKFRLKMSNIPNIIYLIENHDVRGNTQSIIQGISNMQIKDLFTVKETRDSMDSMRYLANLTRYLSLTMRGKTLVSSKEYDSECSIQNDLVRLPEFGFFFAGMGKLRTFTSKEMFTKQLVQLHGLSADKAWAIVCKYHTPKALIEAFREFGSTLLCDLTYGLLNRKLGQNVSSVLFKLYTSADFV